MLLIVNVDSISDAIGAEEKEKVTSKQRTEYITCSTDKPKDRKCWPPSKTVHLLTPADDGEFELLKDWVPFLQDCHLYSDNTINDHNRHTLNVALVKIWYKEQYPLDQPIKV